MAIHFWSRLKYHISVPSCIAGLSPVEAVGYLFNSYATVTPQACTVSLILIVALEICSKWMELKQIIQSEVTQIHKDIF